VETDRLRVSMLPHEFYPAAGRADSVEVVTSGPVGEKPELELDVRGLRYEEAIARLKKQIDNALLAGLREFSVIHGKGEGILQQGIRKYLEQSRVVEEYFYSRPETGGFGKTIVKLKM
jgi:DNA mismatch repair protein MutS2